MFFLIILNYNAQTKEKDEQIEPNFPKKILNYVKPYFTNCKSNDEVSFSSDNASFNIVGLYSLHTNLRKIKEDKYEIYFDIFARIIPISKSLQKQRNYISKTKPVAEILVNDRNSIELKWFGFYNTRTKKYFSIQNPFNPKQNTAILHICEE